MGKVLVIAEKPSVARELSLVLGVTKKCKGYFESKDYYITWFIGHLLTLFDPQDYSETYKKWSIDTLPIIPDTFKYKVREVYGKKDKAAEAQLKVIKELMKASDEIICATDPGAEGEYIFREAYHYLRCSKPVKRLWLKSLTEHGIRSALGEMKQMKHYDNLYHSARCRSESDWIIGINLSRAYSISMKGKYSIGRVQTPTLSMIVQREIVIRNFNPIKFFTLKADFGNFKSAFFVPDRTDGNPAEWIMKRQEAERIKELIDNKDALVEDVSCDEVSEKSPMLYDLDNLRIDCSSAFGLTAEESLQIVQSLYEKKLVSYPRTDSQYLSTKDVSMFEDILDALKNNYSQFTRKIEDKGFRMNPKYIDDSKITEHSALIPTENPIKCSLSEEENKVYDLICRRFISAFYPDYTAKQVNLLIDYPDCDINGKFRASAKATKELGWKEVYEYQDEHINWDVEKGQTLKTYKVLLEEKETHPPSRYTDGSLLEAMKTAGKHIDDPEAKALMKGIGTPATRSGIIERLIKTNYIYRVGKVFHPTPKGEELINLIDEPLLKSPELTGEWEKKRHYIEQGKYSPEQFMIETIELLKSMISKFGCTCEVSITEIKKTKEKTLVICAPVSSPGPSNKNGGTKIDPGAAASRFITIRIEPSSNIQIQKKKEVTLKINLP